MPSPLTLLTEARVARTGVAVVASCCVAFAVAGAIAAADTLAAGAKDYKAFAAEKIGGALAGGKSLQAAIKAGDAKAAQAAWIASRQGWEAAEPITGEFFPKLDEAIDAWPDAKQGYHAIEAALFSGKLEEVKAPADKLVADLAAFNARLAAPKYQFEPQGLLNGATKLAYEVGENKSKGGESPYSGTSLNDIQQNVAGIEAVYKLAFASTLQARDPKLAGRITDKIEDVEKLVSVPEMKNVDQPALKKAGEELAVLLQSAAGKLKLKKPALGE
jgi:iron uptake system component EfeO